MERAATGAVRSAPQGLALYQTKSFMKPHCCILVGLLLVGHAIAATWTIDTNTARPADFRTLQAAHDAASVAAGDTFHLMPSTLSYGNLHLTKRLTIIGPGYLLNQNLPFTVAAPSARTGEIYFYGTGSSGSLVTGCEIAGSVGMRNDGNGFPNNLTIKRNYINGTINNNSDAPSSNVQILQNHIDQGLQMHWGDSSSLLVRGNFVGGTMEFAAAGNSGIISHNVCHSSLNAGGSGVFENNLVRLSINAYGTAKVSKCWAGGIASLGGTPTIVDCVAWTAALAFQDQFVGTGSLDARWQLAAAAAVKGQGVGGVDPGHRAGPDPYVISGLPAVPVVKGILAPSSASAASGLSLTVELQVNP